MLKNNAFRFVFFCALIFPIVVSAQDNPCKQSQMLIGMLNKFHYAPIELNQVASEEIFSDFIESLDPDNIIFTSEDISKLAPFKTRVSNTGSGDESCAFVKATSALYRKKLHRMDSLVSSVLQKPIDLTGKDSIPSAGKYREPVAANDRELDRRWSSRLKYAELRILFAPTGEEDPLTWDDKRLMRNEEDARKKLMVKTRRSFQRILDYPSGLEDYVAVHLLDAIAGRYDPHTQYFSPTGKENFMASVSKEARAFGISFREGKNGEAEIGYVVPGGPAWKSNQLNQGDIPLQVQWPGHEPLDLTSSDDLEVDQVINQSGYDRMKLTVKKNNGSQQMVPLIKEIIDVEENRIAGFIFQGETKIGYISLPGFYMEGDGHGTQGCANDVAREILKLQKENIEALILDLRFNGGGSIREALDLMGIFIDEGPLFMIKMRNQKPAIMKDMNRGTVYTGPLAVMVNGFSASASELVAAGLRDYNRGLITGSTTFGKGVGQAILPLDTTVTLSTALPEKYKSGFVKITVEKIYRVSGASLQKEGIAPDIPIPDLWEGMEEKEASEKYTISGDRTDKKIFYNPLPPLPVDLLLQKSVTRAEQNKVFPKIKELSDSLTFASKQNRFLKLDPGSFRENQKQRKNVENQITLLLRTKVPSYRVMNNRFDEPLVMADPGRKEMNSALIKKLQEDVYIEEVYQIMTDFIHLSKK
ncbi:MAG: S41 family peptidase [Bacteroidetes bacterium]|nr:S41 family peptidase [Bacteroidota bacterium]